MSRSPGHWRSSNVPLIRLAVGTCIGKSSSTSRNRIMLSIRCIAKKTFSSLDGIHIPMNESSKYIGFHLDNRLDWRHHVWQKAEELRHKLYWLTRYYFKLYSGRPNYDSLSKLFGSTWFHCGTLQNNLIAKSYQAVIMKIHFDLRIDRIVVDGWVTLRFSH